MVESAERGRKSRAECGNGLALPIPGPETTERSVIVSSTTPLSTKDIYNLALKQTAIQLVSDESPEHNVPKKERPTISILYVSTSHNAGSAHGLSPHDEMSAPNLGRLILSKRTICYTSPPPPILTISKTALANSFHNRLTIESPRASNNLLRTKSADRMSAREVGGCAIARLWSTGGRRGIRMPLALELPRGMLRLWRWRGDLVMVASETADVEDEDCGRVSFGRGDAGTAVRVDVVDREEEEEAGDRERDGGIGVGEGGVSGFGVFRLVLSSA
ncbi:hypothetical protein BDR05DRAFT_990275 [Suillus weaverae]|nr:hypothetical protein BDR05DRAFT_990275 [Suillus weaverae]